MADYKKYLAAEVLSEGKLVTYRLLSRALKVHVNKAKHMLFEFHESQNAQKPDSVHATYLVYGEKSKNESTDDEDVEMTSSPPGIGQDSLSELAHTLTLTLVQEDRLQDALALYKTVLSIQVYSLGPHPTKDLRLLSEANHQLAGSASGTSELAKVEGCGGILNSGVRRKHRQGPVPALASNPTSKQPSPKPIPAKPSVGLQNKLKTAESSSSSQGGTSTPSGEKPAASGKTGRSGGIMQSFARAAASKTEAKPKLASQPPPNPETKVHPTAMASDCDDDEEEVDDLTILPQPKAPGDSAAARKARADREADLRRMMEEEDESEAQDAPESEEDIPDEPSQDLELAEAKDAADEQPQEQADSQPSELISSSSNGRKRGKRKVIKKKQVQDDEGYFVTIRETAWESFSEDEAPLPQKAAAPLSNPSSGGTGKAKKPAPKGQGSIMSFFAKKS